MSTLLALSQYILRFRQQESSLVVRNRRRVALLDEVAEAAREVRAAEEARAEALDVLRTKIRAARDEGIPFAVIARSAQLSRERARQLYAQD